MMNRKTPAFFKKSITQLDIDNFSLAFNKYPFFDRNDNFAKLNTVYRFPKTLSGKIPYKDIIEAQRNGLAAINNDIIADEKLRFQPEWRLAIGMGTESIHENSITLHHVYGFPYLPGSAVKGITRNHAILSHFSKNEEGVKDLAGAEYRALKCPVFCRIFGCPKEVKNPETNEIEPTAFFTVHQGKEMGQEHQGQIIFADALPTSAPSVGTDVLTPHYPSFYGNDEGKIAPVPYDQPNPVFFLTVHEGTFQFMLARQIRPTFEKEGKDLLVIAKKWLIEALTNRGIGAKTTSGYGYMNLAR